MKNTGDVKVIVGNKSIEVVPGEELTIANHTPSKGELNPPNAIARRHRMVQSVGETMTFRWHQCFVSQGYVRIIKSFDQDGKLMNKVMKTAAVVEMVTRGRGVYAYHQPEQKQLATAAK